MGIQFNTNYWPIVQFSLIEEVNDENFEQYKVNFLNLLLRCKKNKEKMLLICDLESDIGIPMKYVFKLALFNKKIFKFNKLYLQGVCVLSKSKTFKNIFKIYLSLITPSSPYKLCSSYAKINTYIEKEFQINFNTFVFSKDFLNKTNIIRNNEQQKELKEKSLSQNDGDYELSESSDNLDEIDSNDSSEDFHVKLNEAKKDNQMYLNENESSSKSELYDLLNKEDEQITLNLKIDDNENQEYINDKNSKNNKNNKNDINGKKDINNNKKSYKVPMTTSSLIA